MTETVVTREGCVGTEHHEYTTAATNVTPTKQVSYKLTLEKKP